MKPSRSGRRAPDACTMGFSCSKDLRARVRRAARASRRNVSNWIVLALEVSLSAAELEKESTLDDKAK